MLAPRDAGPDSEADPVLSDDSSGGDENGWRGSNPLRTTTASGRLATLLLATAQTPLPPKELEARAQAAAEAGFVYNPAARVYQVRVACFVLVLPTAVVLRYPCLICAPTPSSPPATAWGGRLRLDARSVYPAVSVPARGRQVDVAGAVGH